MEFSKVSPAGGDCRGGLGLNLATGLSYPPYAHVAFKATFFLKLQPQLLHYKINHILILRLKGRAGNINKRLAGF